MRTPLILVLLGILAMAPALAPAQVVQTIVIDGVNDFEPVNLIDADGGDVFPGHEALDLGNIYLTNDANNLYLGFEHDQGGWGTVQLGVAIDVNTAAGGVDDPWSRQLEWSGAANKPDYMYYINLDSNWQASYRFIGFWNGIVSGPGALGVPTDTGFREYSIGLSSIGVSIGDIVNVEVWVTQDGGDKGPLDAAANDAVQLSDADGTIFSVPDPVPMTLMHGYTILDATDSLPPVVSQVGMSANDLAFVQFNEAVDAATAEVTTNYSLPGATITAAAIDAQQPNIVELTLAAELPISIDLYTVTVVNVTDLAGNPIVDQNTGSFLWKNVVILGHMSRYLADNADPPDGFTVEGGTWPLTWDLCDGAGMLDVGDGDYEWSGRFWAPADGEGGASVTFEWKFVHNCTTYEPLPDNRLHTVMLDGNDTDLIEVWWNDEDPSNFTAHDIDVLFFVDMTEFAPGVDDTVAIAGNVAPLGHEWPPAVVVVDDGTGVDDIADDGIYSTVVTFPADSRKNVTYKFRLNGEYECFGQTDRDVFLNDEEFDVIGGEFGPITLPVYHYDACNVSWRAVEVVFQFTPVVVGLPGDARDDPVFSVNGTRSNEEPPAFSWDVPSLNTLADDGVAPDEIAGDDVFAAAVVFPDSSYLFTEYKYLVDDVYEPNLDGNRSFWLNPDTYDALGNPQILELDGYFAPDGVEDVPVGWLVDLANHPNPFNPQTEIHFTVHRAGEGSLRVYDARGTLVRCLHDGIFRTGPHAFTWDGQDESGRSVASGVYLYRLDVGGEVGARKMLLVK